MNRDQLLEYLEHFTSVTDGNRLAELIGRFTLGMGYDYYRLALLIKSKVGYSLPNPPDGLS